MLSRLNQLHVDLGDKRSVSKWIELSDVLEEEVSDEQLEEIAQQLAHSITIEKVGDNFAIQLHSTNASEFDENSNDEDQYSEDEMDGTALLADPVRCFLPALNDNIVALITDIPPKTYWARRLLCFYGTERRAQARIQAVSVFVVGRTDVDCIMGQCTVTVCAVYCRQFKELEGLKLSSTIKLPTVARADPDLMQEFRYNLLRSLNMQYIVPTKSCTLQLRV